MKSASFVSLLMSMGLVAIAVACTKTVTRVVPATPTDAGADSGKVSTKPSTGDDDTADDDTTDDDDDDTTSSSSSSSSGAPTVAECKKTTAQQDCIGCCQQIDMAGAQVYSAELVKCLCQDAVCKDDCKTTICATPQKNPNTACNSCAQGAQETCAQTVITNCNADADCKKFNDCLTAAACGSKPEQ